MSYEQARRRTVTQDAIRAAAAIFAAGLVVAAQIMIVK
jgi:hypothetical protein